jgi:hypothetical protein
MKLLSLLPSEHLRRLRLACTKDDTIEVVANPESFLELASGGKWDALLVDPEVATDKNLAEFLRRLSNVSQPLIIYTSLSRISASAIASLSAHSLAGVVLRNYDDSPDLLRNSLARVPIEFFGAQMVERLGPRVDALPASLRRATTAVFCSARLLRSVTEYATLSGLTRRSVDRWLRRVGLSPAKWIVSTAQFLRAYPLLQSPQLPFAAVSRVTGYGSVRALRHNALVLTGYELKHLRANSIRIDIVALMERATRI